MFAGLCYRYALRLDINGVNHFLQVRKHEDKQRKGWGMEHVEGEVGEGGGGEYEE